MRPITIGEYVENDYQNDVLSYDPIKKKSIFDKVTAKWKRQFSGKMVSLTTRTNRSITTTDEHVMIVSDSLSEKFAKDIKVDDNIPFIADLPDIDTKQSFNFELTNWRFRFNMPKSISITSDFCRLLGYYVSEGSVSNYGKGYSTRFSFNKNELKYISDVCKILEHLGLNYYKTTQKNVTHIGIKSTPFSLFISDTLGCGRESHSKCLPEFIFFVSREMKEQFVSGYFRGDGSFMSSLGLVQVGTVSKVLAAGLDLLLLSMGYVMTLDNVIHSPSVIEGRIITGKMLYTLASKKEIQYNKLASISGFTKYQIHRQHIKNLWHMVNENLYMIKITKTIHEKKCQDVYSIDTKNHLFVSTGGRLIHNCVIPNLNLVEYENLEIVKKINELYEKFKE
ncbi:MAG: LAGLIDADG family homing endonuclease [Nitrosopumilus sp.]